MKPSQMATSPQWLLLLVPAISPRMLSLILTLCYGHLSTTATASKTHLIRPLSTTSRQRSVNQRLPKGVYKTQF